MSRGRRIDRQLGRTRESEEDRLQALHTRVNGAADMSSHLGGVRWSMTNRDVDASPALVADRSERVLGQAGEKSQGDRRFNPPQRRVDEGG